MVPVQINVANESNVMHSGPNLMTAEEYWVNTKQFLLRHFVT